MLSRWAGKGLIRGEVAMSNTYLQANHSVNPNITRIRGKAVTGSEYCPIGSWQELQLLKHLVNAQQQYRRHVKCG
jgi:hypothetical protein